MLTYVERLKLRLLDGGLSITADARALIDEQNEGRPLTPADYASTSGIILQLDGDVWVNAPTIEHNPNFVEVGLSGLVLDKGPSGLVVKDDDVETGARFWKLPDYHGHTGSNGKPYNNYVFSHGDRVRLSPIMGCSMVCKFCNIPYEDRYGIKPIDAMIEALDVALNDPVQPAQHILISGGTPHERDEAYLKDVYRQVLDRFGSTYDVDIMMVPVDGLIEVEDLHQRGLHSLSINIEATNVDLARQLMRQKLQRGLDQYLGFIERASGVLGEGRVRSMLMVGLERPEDTLDGVRLIAEAGGTPVLSPFRPDPVTPLADHKPPTAVELEEIWLAAKEVMSQAGAGAPGPDCPPCTHNTVTFLGSEPPYPRPTPRMI